MGTSSHTTLSQSVKDWWKSPKGTVIHIEVLVVLTATILLFLAVFGSQRRRSRNFFIQKGVWGSYALSSSLVSYTLGSMQSSPVKSNIYSIWAISLYVLSSCADSITAYSLDDHDQYKTQTFQYSLYYVYVLMIMSSSGYDMVTIHYLGLVASYKFMHRLLVPQLATVSWNLNKMVADYMCKEHIWSGSSYDPASMKGYHYLVDWPLHKSTLDAGTSYATLLTDAARVIDIERIWLCNSRSLSPELKDTCLSFSLFHLLRRRFFGFQCGESLHQKTHDFVFKGLLSKTAEGTIDYNRIFKVIDVELAFMYDFFFTKYAVLYYGSWYSTFWSLASAGLISITASQILINFPVKMSSNDVLNTTTAHATIAFTFLILASIALLELLQLLLYWTTIWGRVSFVCHYVREQAPNIRGSYCMRFKEILTRIGVFASKECYYREKLGQYSLVKSVKYDPSPFMAGVDVPIIRKRARFFQLLDSSAFYHNMHMYALRVRKRHGKPIKLPTEVKRVLVQSLQRTDGKLTNGESSLLSNGAHHLLWACRHDMHLDSCTRFLQGTENQTCFILTWHIATCYCEMATLKCLSPRVGGELKFNFDVATILSKYCAYLIVSMPKLLPGHHYDTSRVFDAVAAEAAQFLPGDKYEAMRNLPESTQMSIFPKGVKLGKQLEEMEEGTCWKVLADFWAEMMLYVAPSDNVKEHIECLANGGEFITHLWALLTHAGILERDQRNVGDIESAVAGQPCSGQGLCGSALRFRRASSCPLTSADKQAAPATCIINQQATHGNCVQQTGMVQQLANLVQNVGGTTNASTAPSENEEIDNNKEGASLANTAHKSTSTAWKPCAISKAGEEISKSGENVTSCASTAPSETEE